MPTSNTFLTISQITYESAIILMNNLKFGSMVNRQYDDQYARQGAKIGATLNIRKPPRFVGRQGAVAKYEGIQEQYATLTLDMFGVDMNYSSFDMTLSMDNFSDRYLKPAAATIANYVDRKGVELYNRIANTVGTPGTTPNSFLTYMTAGAVLSQEATPNDGMRSLCLEPISMATIAASGLALFNPTSEISNQYTSGLMSRQGGFNWYEDQNMVSHTVGALGGTPLVNGANQTGSSLVTDGWTAAAATRLNVGDVFTIAGVYAVNPQSRASTGRLRQFVVTAAGVSDGSGNMTISIYPAITPPDTLGNAVQFQTVTASPADNAAITVLGAANTVSPQNLAFHRDAVALAFADLEIPRGAVEAERVSDPETGISIRVIHYYDGSTDVSGARMDVCFGYEVIYPELMCRVAA